ncbi:LysR family transcriptional regulator [Streptacidiphilus sp. N1-12]|uniref:LysR family transcriptional regulator n=2 Tax=Streptacidiphilus alkalitolerans TaxID=3342712 RepID=A0ABV6VEA0_9ACTN
MPLNREARGYSSMMEFRQLEAFAAVASELHFGRAAQKLYVSQPTVSELVRRLERELHTPLFTRTTRRVALTAAGVELLPYAKSILADATAATAAVQRVTEGQGGTVRVGLTPPAAPVLAPHLVRAFQRSAPRVTVRLEQMWLPTLTEAVITGAVDVALSCGLPPDPHQGHGDGDVVSAVCAAEPLLVGLRPEHRYAGQAAVSLEDLAHDVLGATRVGLFPAWALAQRQALEAAGVHPPAVDLLDTDLAATHWFAQPEVDWILLIGSLASSHTETVVLPVAPSRPVPFTLRWNPARAQPAAVAAFVHTALSTDPPAGWSSPSDTP